MNTTQRRKGRFRRIDLVALCGVIAGVLGAVLFTRGADYLPVWLAWLLSPMLWWLGSGMVLGWALIRVLASDGSKMGRWLREKLIETAGKVFAEVGFDEATLREISSRAGTSEAAVHDQFGDKMGLYTEVLKTPMFANQEAALSSSTAYASDPQAALRALVGEWIERSRHGATPEWFAPVMAREMAKPTPALDRVAEGMGGNYLRLRTLVGHVIGPGPNDPETRMCVHSVVGQVLHYVQSREMLARLWPDLTLDNQKQRRAIAAHIVAFSLAGMQSLSHQHAEAIRREQ